MIRARPIAVTLCALVLVAGCGAPPSVKLGVKEYPADIVYGDRGAPTPPTLPPQADPLPAFPGFIVPPAPRVPSAADGSVFPPVTRPPARPSPCPDDDPLSVPAEATDTIPGSPLAGGYGYRQVGVVSVDGHPKALLPEQVTHRVDIVETRANGDVRFDVGVEEFGVTTITTYDIVRRGVEDGLYISQIRTADQVSLDAFTPTVPIKVLPTPTLRGTRWSSAGTDPLHQITITLHGTVTGKTRINACGTPVDAWLVTIGTEPNTGQPSSIVGPDKNLVITGTYAVAPQFGGLIVGQSLDIQGRDDSSEIRTMRSAFVNNVVPEP